MEHGNGSREGEVVDTHYTYRCYIIVALRSCDISWFCVCVCLVNASVDDRLVFEDGEAHNMPLS